MPQTLLVADDSLTIQRVIKLALADEDLDVVAVSCGEAAIEQIEAQPPALVLADTRMPDRTGYEIAEFLNSNPTHKGIPVVLMSGAFEPLDERRAKAAGCVAVLVKPVEPAKLVSTVRELLGSGPKPRATASPPMRSVSGEPDLTWPVTDDLSAAPVSPELAPDPVAESPPPARSAPPPIQADPPAPRVRPEEPTPPALVITDDLVDQLATRVIARLSDRVVRETTTEVVSRVAEQLVREEIERLKDKLR